MRYTETNLDKIVRIGMARIDQVFDKCCDDLEKIKPISMTSKKCWFESDESETERFQREVFGRLAAAAAQAGHWSRHERAYGQGLMGDLVAAQGCMGAGAHNNQLNRSLWPLY